MSSKMPPQYLFALILAICVGVIALFWTLFVKPRQDTIATMRDDLATRQTTADQYRSAVAGLPQLKASIDKMEVDRAEFVRALPTNAQFGQVVDQIRGNVSAAKADLKDLTFANSQDTSLPAGVRAMDLNLGVSGQFAQIFQVLRSLETQNRFTTIKNIDLTLPQANSSDPKLESKLNVTVYTFDPTLASATPAGTPGAAPEAGAAPAAPAAAPAAGGIR